jgi:hypothetical protein
VHVSFESIVDLSQFTVRIPQADAEKLPQLLAAIPQERRQRMRRALAHVWHRFAYSSYGPYARRVKELQTRHVAAAAGDDGGGGGAVAAASLPEPVPDLDPERDDAFLTIMAWLHSRIPATRGDTDGRVS